MNVWTQLRSQVYGQFFLQDDKYKRALEMSLNLSKLQKSIKEKGMTSIIKFGMSLFWMLNKLISHNRTWHLPKL